MLLYYLSCISVFIFLTCAIMEMTLVLYAENWMYTRTTSQTTSFAYIAALFAVLPMWWIMENLWIEKGLLFLFSGAGSLAMVIRNAFTTLFFTLMNCFTRGMVRVLPSRIIFYIAWRWSCLKWGAQTYVMPVGQESEHAADDFLSSPMPSAGGRPRSGSMDVIHPHSRFLMKSYWVSRCCSPYTCKRHAG